MDKLALLIVDDSPADTEIIKYYLHQSARYDFIFWEAELGEEALELCKTVKPDCILVNYILPDMNGLEFLDDYLALNQNNAALVMFTGQGSEEVVIAALQRNVYHYLVKDKLSPELLQQSVISAVEKHRIKLKLEEEQANNRAILESISEGFFALDFNWRYIYLNQIAAQYHTKTVDQLKGKILWDILPDLIGSKIHQVLDYTMTNRVAQNLEYFDERRSKWFDMRIYPTRQGISVYFQNIDDRKQIEIATNELNRVLERNVVERTKELKEAYQELIHEKELIAVTLSSIGEAIITTDVDLCIKLFNPVAEKLTGWTAASAIGVPITEVFRVQSASIDSKEYNPVGWILQNRAETKLVSYQTILPLSGSELRVASTTAPIYDNKGGLVGAVLAFRDVGDEQRLNNEWAKVTKLESLSLLAGGIAHDFNNALTVILGNISAARINVPAESDIANYLTEATNATVKAKELASQLLTFAKGGEPIKKIISPNQLLSDTARFALSGSNVRLQLNLAPDLWSFEIDPEQISRVIQNLTLNAVQAMPSGGTLEIAAENVLINDTSNLPLYSGNYVLIKVKDEGLGIPTELLDKIFDPYFTTKEKGNGMGLAICYSIINRHDGHITVEPNSGNGTTFFIYLPATLTEISAVPLLPQAPPSAKVSGYGRILLMDDDPAIRRMVSRLLKNLGYQVEPVADGREAIKVYEEAIKANRGFDLVIMDLTIPAGLGGAETLPQLQALDPKVKAIVSSGYANNAVMANYRDYGFQGLLGKPYQLNELTKVLEEVLQRS